MGHSDMTEGVIWKQISFFVIPLLLGNLLQQLYNAFDAIVVGNYVGKEALAAVGSSGTLINMIIAFFVGMSTGASVLISQSYGARNRQMLHDVIHTAIALAVILGVVLSCVGILLTPWLLRLISTPESILPEATAYLTIFFVGMTALTVYNMGTAILTAVGDTRRPLYFLAVSAVLNIVLDLLFVRGFGMGVAGVAYATIVAEAVSAVLVILSLCHTESEYRLSPKELRIDPGIVKRIVVIGLPGGIQQAVISFSNLIVQSYINRLGAEAAAGFSATTKLDAFIMLPTQTMALAATTFVGQNLGARQVKRAGGGVMVILRMGLGIALCLSAVIYFNGVFFLRIFTPDPNVLATGIAFMRVFVPFHFILCFTQILPGALRGAGDVRLPTLTNIFCMVVVRQIYLYIVSRVHFTITTVAAGYPVGWMICAVILVLYYLRRDWSNFETEATKGVV